VALLLHSKPRQEIKERKGIPLSGKPKYTKKFAKSTLNEKNKRKGIEFKEVQK
jgi:hypothetical protein